MKTTTEADIAIGLLEFPQTPEMFEKLGRMVWDILKRSESRREYANIKGNKLYCQECVIHGT